MENININETESKTDKPSIETLSTINELDKEFLEFTKRPDLDANPDATFKWLDDWTEKRFGLKGERGSVWQKDRTAYSTPGEYARALTGLLNRGYQAIATPEYNALIAAEKANNRDEIIKLGNISLEKREAYEDAYGLPIGTHMVKKTDEEIDKEIKEYTAKVKSQNFAAHFLSFADDFTPQEKDIVYASLRYGDGLPAEKEADYLAVWRENPEKAARLDYLIKLSRKNEYAWMRDNLWHPLATGMTNIYHGMGDELYDFAEFQSLISYMKDIVKGDGERRMWNDEERKLYHDLEARKATKQMDLNRRGLGNSALFQTFTSAADVGVTNPRAHVDEICARRMAREALPREEQLKRRKEQLMLRLATSHQPYDDYDPVSNAISGAIGSVPYMAVAAIPYAGIAINTFAQFGNVRNDIILNGGNPDDAAAAQLLLAMGWSAIEKMQFLTFAKPLTGLQKKAILNRIAQTAWKNGKLGALGSAIRQGAPEFIAKTFAECVEEGLQGAVEGGTKQWWMPEEKGGGDWSKTVSAALTQGAKDFIDSIGMMGIISLVGSGINQTQARRNALSVESMVDYAGRKMQVMNIMTGRVNEMADNKDAPANAQKMLNEITQIWQAHKGNAVAALDEMREKYGLTDAQARTVGDYLDLQTTLLNLAKTAKSDEEASAIAAFAGGAYRVGQTTDMGDTAYDVTDLFRMVSPNITVEDIEVDDKTKAPVASPAVENLRQERDAALKRIEEAKVGSQRKAAERELRRINKKLKAAEANENAVSYPKMTMRRVTIPVGKNGETRSFVIREDNEAPDIHSDGYAQSAVDAVKGDEKLKAGEKVSLQEFKALSLEDKLNIAVTQEQYMSMSDAERVAYVQKHNLGGSGSFALLDNTGKEIFNSDAIVSLFRGKVGTPGARIGGNWTLAHEYTHGVVRFLRDIGAIDDGTVALMRRLFGEPTSDNELWNEEAMANGFAEFLRGEFDFRRLTPEERREAMGFFERVWDIIKDFFRRIFGKEIDEPPVVANLRKEAERAVFNALRNGDLSGLDQYAGIEFEEEKNEEAKAKGEDEEAQNAREAASKPSEEKTTNEPPKSEERAPTASTPSNTAKDAPKEPTKAETAPAATPTTDVAAVVEQIENPIATAANLPARTNTKKTIFTPGYEMEIECEMMWVPLNELAESTDDREVQMRDRTRRATDEQVRSKTRKGVFRPLALFPGKKSDDGAPIVGGGMKIISGHGRKRMLEALAAEGRFNEYLSAINAEAQRQGVPTAPEGIENPVLVLRVTGGLDNKSDLNRFAELSNRWGGLERSGAELAESDARKITDALLRLYNPDASGNLLAASNRDFMAAFLKEVGATGLTNADGTPTPEAALRVQRALMTAIFGNDEKIRAIIRDLLEKSGELSLGNLQNALMRLAGKILAMKRAKGSFDIVNDVREAAYHYIAWRSAQRKQKSLTFVDYLREQDMFAEVATPMQAALAKLLEVGRFGTVLDEYSKLVAQEAVDAQGAFDFAEKRTPLQLLGYAERNTLAAEETPVTPDPTSAEARFSVTIAQAQREYNEVVSRFTNPDGTPKAGWMKAPNGKPTKLTERQWVQVRTPSFKKWFGDWENVLRRNRLDAARVAPVKAGAFVRKDGNTVQQTAKALFPTAKEYSTDVGKVVIDARSAHTSLSHGYSQKKLDALVSIQDDFNNAVYIGSEPDFDGRDITNHYFAYPIEYGEGKERNYVFCRAREDKNTNRLYLHEVLLESDVKNKGDAFQTAAASSLKDASHTNASPVKKPQGAFLPRIILQRLFAVNPDSVSKVVDENGEPLVVWHGSNWDPMSEPNGSAVFRTGEGETGSGAHFGTLRAAEERGAGRKNWHLTPAYLNIKNPLRVGDTGYWTAGDIVAEVRKTESDFPWFETWDEIKAELKRRGYDGMVYKNVVEDEGSDSYIAFEPSQIKSATDNTGAFDSTNADVRFSIAAPVERSKNLIALHNLKPSDLAAAAELEGMPAPSIAVVKDSMGHDNYGPISLVFRADAIDPKGGRNNKIYSSDAWTPTRGSVNIKYKVLDEKLDEIIASLINAGDENYRKLFKAFSERGSLGDTAENAIAAGEYYRLWHNDAILLSYLHSKEQSVPLSFREQAISHNYSNAVVKGVSDAVGDKIAEIWENGGKTGDEEAVERMSEIMRPAAVKAKDDENPEGAAERRAKGVPTLGERLYGAALKRPWDLAKAVMQYREHGITEEIDTFAVSKTMSEILSTDDPAYQEWVRSTFAPAVGAKGIRNKRDLFTPSGSRRSWEALHDEVTAQRIVDMMYHNNKEVGGNGFGGYNPEGAAVRQYASIAEMRRDRDRLQAMPEEEWNKLRDETRKDFIAAVSSLQSKQKHFYSDNVFVELDSIQDIVLQGWIAAKGDKEKYLANCKDELHVYDESDCSDIWDVMMRLRNAPTKYFEAKPERVVGFDEVAFAVVPDDSSAETVDILKTRGIETHTYKAEDKEDRLRVLNEAANANNIRFSIAAESPLYVRDIEGEHEVLRIEDVMKGRSEKELREFLRKNPEAYVRLYHGTGAQLEGGLKRTSAKTRRTSAVTRGYVYLSATPATARRFGEFGYDGNASVWAVDVKVKELKPDGDSIFLSRQNGRDIERDDLAASLFHTGNARVKRDIAPWEISPTRFSIGGVYTGTSADYDKPSLHYVGTGEGSQVYGWGLYGSTVRGVVDHKWVDGEQRWSVTSAGAYSGELRTLAHDIKDGKSEAIERAATLMAPSIPEKAVLVPMPSHEGRATTMLSLANAIAAKAQGATVIDALEAEPHEANYEHKKRTGKPTDIKMSRIKGVRIPKSRPVVLIDNVIATATTYNAALKALPNADIVVLASDARHSVRITKKEYALVSSEIANQESKAFSQGKEPPSMGYVHTFDYGYQYYRFADTTFSVEKRWKLDGKNGRIYWELKEEFENGIDRTTESTRSDNEALRIRFGKNRSDYLWATSGRTTMGDVGMAGQSVRHNWGIPNGRGTDSADTQQHPGQHSDARGIKRHHVRRGRTPRSIDDTLTSYVAAQIMGGTDVTIEDMRKIVSSASGSTRAADILERAKTLANDNRAKAVAKAASSVAETSARLGDMLETDRLNKALSDAVTMGAKAANPETGRKLQQAIERKRIRDLQAAEGFTAAEIMAELPLDLAEAVLATAELERTPEELAKLEAAKKKREEERAKALETEEGAEELADPEAPMRDPTEAERKAVDDLLDRARMRDDLAKQEEERKRAEKAKRDAEEAAEGGESDGDAADDIPLLPEEAVRRIAPVFESADVFSWFIIELTGDKTLEKHPELPSTGEMWKSPVAIRELKKTAADILRRLAKDTLGSPSINHARNLVDRAINELESDLETRTFNSVRHKIAHIYEMIWDNAHRITKNELMEELEKTVSKLTQKGRFSYTQEEMDRDIPAKIERWAGWVLKYARMGEAKLQKEIANLENLTSMNPKSEDGKMPTPIELAEAPDKLAVANVYGHLKGKNTGEMRDLIDQIAAKLDGERQAFELRRAKIEEANKTIVDALVNALTQGKANRRKRAKAKGIIDRAMELMISSIDQQMVDLVRFCTDPELRKKALEAIDELTILINEGGNRYRNTLATAQEEIHDGLKACYGDAAKGIRHLHEELPEEIAAQFFRQSSDQKRTYGHLLQLYASCLQRDYAKNVRKHGRDEQIAAMEAALTAQDKMFHTWAVNWYKHNRQALSDAVEEVTGLPVIAPDELYVPVRVETEPSGIPAEVVAWSPIPSALNRRVRHGLDFDENAHFLTMVNNQAEVRAQTIGYAMTGIILRDTIASRDVQTAARRNASPSDMNAVILHLRDILAQDVGKERSDGEICLKFLRKWAARFNIAWNPSSALAQPASIPVWANVLLDGGAWGAMSVLKAMSSAATEEGRAAIAELRASDGYRARYKLGWSEEVANVYANPNEPKLLSKLEAAYDKGMILSQFTDACCSLLVAQGFYRHATDVFVRRGETIEEAKRKALALTWAAVEQTQQSGRIENLSALQRGKGKNIINAILQFKTAQILQNSYIIRAIRDVRAGVPGAKGRLARAIFISTVWVPGYLSLKGALWALIMGVKPEPDDEDEMPLWFREMLYSAVDGVTAPLFVTSLFVEKPLREMLSLKSYPRRTGFASVDTAKRLVEDAYDLISDPIMLEEELTSEKIIDDIWKVIGDTFAPARHLRKAINNRRED